jgi:hypothetical protein
MFGIFKSRRENVDRQAIIDQFLKTCAALARQITAER